MKSFVWALALCFAFAAHANADVFLNELRVDQGGADTDEYFELFSNTGMSLDGIFFISLQDNGSIDGVVDLTGNTIAAGDVFLVAESDPLPTFGVSPDFVSDINLENGENSSYFLAEAFTGAVGDDLDTNDDGAFDVALPWASILDGISMVDDEDTILNGGTEDIDYSAALGLNVVGPDGTFYPAYVFASVDGGGIDSIGEFDPASTTGVAGTPGELNVSAVPEPATAVLFGLAGLGLCGVRRRS